MDLINHFKNVARYLQKEPTVKSGIQGLVLEVEKKEGTLPVLASGKPYAAEDHYYQVTLKSNGRNSKYPLNESIWTKNFVRLLPDGTFKKNYAGLLVPGPTISWMTDDKSTVFIPPTDRFSSFKLTWKDVSPYMDPPAHVVKVGFADASRRKKRKLGDTGMSFELRKGLPPRP